MTIREAEARDEAALAELTSTQRALPDEWDEWADEPHRTLVAEEDGRLCGAANVAIVGITEGWVEGLRVRPDSRRRGMARALHQEALEVIRHYGGRVSRTGVPSGDYAALALAEREGYERVATFDVLLHLAGSAPDVPYEAEVHRAERSEAGEVLRRLRATLPEELIPLGWRFRTIREEMVAALVREGRALVAGADASAAALVTDHPDMVVCHALAGEAPGLRALASALGERARDRGASGVAAFVPHASAASDVLRARGFAPHPWCAEGVVVVEKRL